MSGWPHKGLLYRNNLDNWRYNWWHGHWIVVSFSLILTITIAKGMMSVVIVLWSDMPPSTRRSKILPICNIFVVAKRWQSSNGLPNYNSLFGGPSLSISGTSSGKHRHVCFQTKAKPHWNYFSQLVIFPTITHEWVPNTKEPQALETVLSESRHTNMYYRKEMNTGWRGDWNGGWEKGAVCRVQCRNVTEETVRLEDNKNLKTINHVTNTEPEVRSDHQLDLLFNITDGCWKVVLVLQTKFISYSQWKRNMGHPQTILFET